MENCVLLTYFQDLLSGTPRNLRSDLLLPYLHFLGFSGPLGGQGQHKPRARILEEKTISLEIFSFASKMFQSRLKISMLTFRPKENHLGGWLEICILACRCQAEK